MSSSSDRIGNFIRLRLLGLLLLREGLALAAPAADADATLLESSPFLPEKSPNHPTGK